MSLPNRGLEWYLNPPNCADCNRSVKGGISFRIEPDKVICPQCKGKRKKAKKRKKKK